MKYFLLLFTIPPAIYLVSFAIYQWKNGKWGSFGAILLAVASVAFPTALVILRS